MKHRALLLTLLALLLIIGIPVGLLTRAYHQEQASRDLIAAIQANDTHKALTALKAGADPNFRWEPSEVTPTLRDRVKWLFEDLRHPQAQPESDERLTPLLLLCLDEDVKDNPTLVKALLDAGADPNATGWDGHDSALMLATRYETPLTFRLLLTHGGNVHLKNVDGETALHRAACFGDPETVKRLIANGADVNALDHMGITPLMNACTRNMGNVKVLLENHAEVNLRDKHGKTALDYARSGDDKERLEGTGEETEQILRKAGAKTGKELSAQPFPLN